uniref:G-patch domain and KOW motifs-containing protein n=1 Tax=Sinocyclocheilus grahami TaxID=75366 RepID=A0A672TDE1_SINGR
MASPERHQERESLRDNISQDDGGKKSGPISFGFSKTLSKVKSGKAEERDYLVEVEGKELKGTKPVEKPKELVIPLIHKNRWYRQDAEREDKSRDPSQQEQEQEQDTVESQAVKELIEESQKHQERWKNGSQMDPNFAIPLLMQNQAPQGFEDGDKVKVDLRPEFIICFCSLPACFSHIHIYIYIYINLSLVLTWSLSQIEGVDPDNARVIVKLAIGGKTATIIQHSLKLVSRKEYDKNSKDLSRLSKAHKDKEREKEREQQREREERLNGKDVRGKTDRVREREKDRERDQKKRKPRESKKPPPAKEPRPSPPAPSWLQRDLHVRFIDKAFKGGKYYNSKMRVEDVLTPHTCVCRTEEGRLLDDIRQKMLETIVPKNDSDYIMVVLGEHRGQVGRILKRDREKCRAMVQLDRYEEQVFTLDYDAICHYVGGTEH